ncbi:hypothetical protein [Rhodococcus jostii]|uniref:hypothetical protein n=1 Tax=Rhodococcus jostii TaxID=132919 RepID=UPI0036283515
MIVPPWEGSGITITGVKAILTAPEATRLVVVKVETSEPGLYGVGCATFSQRAHAVASAAEDYLAPLVIGRDPADIEDIWQSCFLSSYWRSGPVLNNALSGIDQALWDIKGKLANVPVYQLFGGKVRQAADVYVHVKGDDLAEVAGKITALTEQGYRCVRAQPMSPGRLDMAQPTWDGRA